MSDQPTLSCSELDKSFEGLRALSAVTLEFPPGKTTAIVGPNGAGKTTLVNVLTGFLKPDRGVCRFGGTEITGLSPHRIAGMGIRRTFQDLRLIRDATAVENVALSVPDRAEEGLLRGLTFSGKRGGRKDHADQALEILNTVGLGAQTETRSGDLSFGQQKRLTIACCLAANPNVLLLDEPVAGVEPTGVQAIIELLNAVRERGTQVIFVEHDLVAVRALAGHLVVMDEGEIVAKGPPDSVLDDPMVLEAFVG